MTEIEISCDSNSVRIIQDNKEQVTFMKVKDPNQVHKIISEFVNMLADIAEVGKDVKVTKIDEGYSATEEFLI